VCDEELEGSGFCVSFRRGFGLESRVWWRTLNLLLTCVAFVVWFGVIYVVMTMVTRGSDRRGAGEALNFVNRFV
jgi:uncharacterized membrane protein